MQEAASFTARNGRNVESRALRDVQSIRLLPSVVTNRGKRWGRGTQASLRCSVKGVVLIEGGAAEQQPIRRPKMAATAFYGVHW